MGPSIISPSRWLMVERIYFLILDSPVNCQRGKQIILYNFDFISLGQRLRRSAPVDTQIVLLDVLTREGGGGGNTKMSHTYTEMAQVVPDWSDQVLDQVNCAWQFLNNRTQHSQFLRCFSWLSGWMNAPPIFKSTCKVNWDDPKKWCKIGQAGFNLEHQINRTIYSIANRRRWVFCFCQFLWWWTQNQN